MSDDDFNLGYYEGIREVLNIFLVMHMEGSTLPEIRDELVKLRALAKRAATREAFD